jgi:hypothetical protein
MKLNGMYGAVVGTIVAISGAHGAVAWVSQYRAIRGFVHAEEPGPPPAEDSFEVLASGFGPFDQARSINVAPPLHPNRRADAQADQHSALNEDLISATGRIFAGTLGTPPAHYGWAESLFSVTFDVDVASPFHLQGSVFLAQVGSLPTVGIAMLTLTGPGVDFSRSLTSFGTLTIDEVGVLSAGRYSLVARAYSDIRDAPTYSAEGTYGVSLAIVPAPSTWGVLALGGWLAFRRRRLS